jgi:hypothetical protein
MSKAAWLTSAVAVVALATGLTAAPATELAVSAGVATRQQTDFVLACENGRSYPIQARAVTDQGDLVTGYVWTGRHHPAHIRLVPMGAGYRYAARGLWIDGWRQDAILNFGKNKSLACDVVRG